MFLAGGKLLVFCSKTALRAEKNVEAESDKNEWDEDVAIPIYQSNHNEVITNRITCDTP